MGSARHSGGHCLSDSYLMISSNYQGQVVPAYLMQGGVTLVGFYEFWGGKVALGYLRCSLVASRQETKSHSKAGTAPSSSSACLEQCFSVQAWGWGRTEPSLISVVSERTVQPPATKAAREGPSSWCVCKGRGALDPQTRALGTRRAPGSTTERAQAGTRHGTAAGPATCSGAQHSQNCSGKVLSCTPVLWWGVPAGAACSMGCCGTLLDADLQASNNGNSFTSYSYHTNLTSIKPFRLTMHFLSSCVLTQCHKFNELQGIYRSF